MIRQTRIIFVFLQNMKVSVIVPTYNQEKLIQRTLHGILMQQRDFEIEIIVGDDASTDNTGNVIKVLAAKHPEIVYVRQPVNSGFQNNYFNCIERACGEYIADCGGDDEWTDPTKLARQVAMLDANPDMSMVHTGWQYRHEPTGVLLPSEPSIGNWPYLKERCEAGELFMPLLTRRPTPLLHLCTAVWRRDWFMEEYEADKSLFRNTDFGVEDVQIAVTMARRGAVGYIPDVTMAYSVGKSSISSLEDPEKAWHYIFGTLLLFRRLAEKYNVPPQQMQETYTQRLDILYGFALQLDSREKMIRTRHLASELGISIKPMWRLMLAASYLPGTAAAYRTMQGLRKKLKSH